MMLQEPVPSKKQTVFLRDSRNPLCGHILYKNGVLTYFKPLYVKWRKAQIQPELNIHVHLLCTLYSMIIFNTFSEQKKNCDDTSMILK